MYRKLATSHQLAKPSWRPWREDKETTVQFGLYQNAMRDLAIFPKRPCLSWHNSDLNSSCGSSRMCVTKQSCVWLGSGLVLSARTGVLTHNKACLPEGAPCPVLWVSPANGIFRFPIYLHFILRFLQCLYVFIECTSLVVENSLLHSAIWVFSDLSQDFIPVLF